MATVATTVYRPYPYYGPTPITKPIVISPAQAAVLPAITINMPAPPTAVTPVQSGAPAAVAAQEGWLDQSTSGISNKLLAGIGVVAALYLLSRKG